MDIEKAVKEAEARKEERHDNKSEIIIYNKETNEVDNRFFEYPDAAVRVAESKIWGRKYLAYKIITVT